MRIYWWLQKIHCKCNQGPQTHTHTHIYPNSSCHPITIKITGSAFPGPRYWWFILHFIRETETLLKGDQSGSRHKGALSNCLFIKRVPQVYPELKYHAWQLNRTPLIMLPMNQVHNTPLLVIRISVSLFTGDSHNQSHTLTNEDNHSHW